MYRISFKRGFLPTHALTWTTVSLWQTFAYKNIRQSAVNLASTEGVLEHLLSLLPCVGWM